MTAFVGTGYGTSSAIGVQLTGVDLGLLLAKPTVASGQPAPTRSYMALKATATSVALIGLSDVGMSATNLSVEINRGSDSAAAPGAIVPTLDLSKANVNTGLKIATGPGAGQFVTLDFAGAVTRAAGRVSLQVLGVSIAGDVTFEKLMRGTTPVTKIGIGDLDISLGAPASFSIKTGSDSDRATKGIQTYNGMIVLTPQGMAADFTITGQSFVFGTATDGLTLTNVSLEFAINTTPSPINETFGSGADQATMKLPAGRYLRFVAGTAAAPVTAKIAVAGNDLLTITAAFQFEQTTTGTAPATQTVTRIGLTSVSIVGSWSGAQLTGGTAAFIIAPGGVAGTIRGAFVLDTPIGGADGEVVLNVNTTSADVNASVNVAGELVGINVAKHTLSLGVRSLSVSFGDFLTLKGDFTIVKQADRTIYGAKNVEIFLGSGPYRLTDGTVNPDAIGVVVRNAEVGVVKYVNDANNPNDDTFALFAYGEAGLVGLDGFDVSGSIRVLINQTGKAVTDQILLPGNGVDDNNNGVVDDAAESDVAKVTMPFTTGAYQELFEAGVNEDGSVNAAKQVKISVGGIFTIQGSIRFTKAPTGRVDADIPDASIKISVPFDGSLQDVFALNGVARFSFGGGQAFQLQDFRINGVTILGQTVSIPTPASQLRAPTLELASPYSGQLMSLATVNANHYIDVQIKPWNYDAATKQLTPIDDTTLIDGNPEIALFGARGRRRHARQGPDPARRRTTRTSTATPSPAASRCRPRRSTPGAPSRSSCCPAPSPTPAAR